MCTKFLNSLNPNNDWVEDKSDSLDHEDDEKFNDINRQIPHLYPHGSDLYGHIVFDGPQ